jgi:hypothetical protein
MKDMISGFMAVALFAAFLLGIVAGSGLEVLRRDG